MEALEDFIWNEVWGDLNPSDNFPQKTPHVAHYTSIENTKNILSGEEL